ncbi:HlyD family efflux transporter periplasmic adaptor subunit [Candidatus Methanoplasma termitum]|nr:HlyD family efflux transporter periplasmic adaptor subunit [Candidatus Methanoplasma termitum]
MTLQAGSMIGSVSNPIADRYVDLYITAAQRALIDVGQECNFTIDGLAQTEYGSINGTVESISSDAITQEGGAYFRVKVSFDADYIQDSKGGKVNLSNGMTVRAWVTYEKVTYLKYWMEQLGLGKYL